MDDYEIGKKSIVLRRYESEQRVKALEKMGFEVRVVWEHEINEMLETDKDMKLKFFKMMDISPIDPREAFFGGKRKVFFFLNFNFRTHWSHQNEIHSKTRRKNLLLRFQ